MVAAGATEIFLLLVLGLSTLLPIGVPPLPEDPGLARVGSSESVLFFESRGLATADPTSMNEVERLLAEPEVKAFTTAVVEALESAITKSLRRESPVIAQELPQLLRLLVTRPVAVFVERLEIHVGRPPDLLGGLVLNAGGRAENLERSLRMFTSMITGTTGEGGFPTERVAGAEIHALPADRDLPPVAWGRRENYVFVGIGKGAAAEIARRLAGEAQGGQPAGLARAISEFGVDRPALLGHVEVASIIEAIPPQLQRRFRPVWDSLGLNAIGAVTQVSGLDGKEYAVHTLVATHGKLRGLLAPFQAKPLATGEIAPIPADATFALAGRLDAETVYREILDAVGRIEPRARERLAREILEAESELGFRLSEDLFQALGNTWRLYSSPGEGGLLITGLTVVADVRDEARLQRTLDRFASLVGGALASRGRPDRLVPPRTTRFQGKTIYYMDLGPGRGRRDFLPLAPAWCLTDGKIVVSLFPQMVKAHLRRISEPEQDLQKTSLATLPDMAALWKGETAPIGVSRIDTRAFFRILYPFLPPLVEVLSSMARSEGVDIPAALFPSAPAIEPHLLPAVSAFYRTDEGILMVHRGTHPLAAGGIAPLAVPMLLFTTARYDHARATKAVAMAETRAHAATAVADKANLRNLFQAIAMYRLEHGENPSTLRALVEARFLKSLPRGRNGQPYLYFREDKSPERDRILAAAPSARNNQRTVLFADGSVRTLAESEFSRKTAR